VAEPALPEVASDAEEDTADGSPARSSKNGGFRSAEQAERRADRCPSDLRSPLHKLARRLTCSAGSGSAGVGSMSSLIGEASLGPTRAAAPLLQHFRGNLDNWDPALTDALAAQREVMLVDYAGVGSSTGEPSSSIGAMARQMIAFVDALGLDRIDLLGFSIGGFVAQEIALVRPTLIRRLVMAATGPKGGPGMHGWRPDIAAAARGESKPENLLYIMFAHTDTSQAKGREFLGRFMARQDGREAPTTDAARGAQYDAVVDWGIPDHGALQRLTGIRARR
jgi:pimeloyl-ACP methyl ester carboxylesterase